MSTKQTKQNKQLNSNTCANCNKYGVSKICSACHDAYYCDSKCQRLDWKIHKKQCKSNKKNTRTQSKKTLSKNPPQIKYVNICEDDITKCDALDRIINELKFYKTYTCKENIFVGAETSIMSRSQSSHVTTLINDFHHLLHSHLNEDVMCKEFQYIYKKIMNQTDNILHCNINKCKMHIRNNRMRERDGVKMIGKHVQLQLVILYRDLMDTIHCYFIHSYDIGYNILDYDSIDIGTNDDSKCTNNYYDQKLEALQKYCAQKRKDLVTVRGIQRMNNNKFVTNNEQITDNEKVYDFGVKYNYFDKEADEWMIPYMKPKYVTMKDELLNNKIYTLEMDVLIATVQRADMLLNLSNVIKKMKTCRDLSSLVHYCIPADMPIGLNLVLSVILYTDYDTLSYMFSKTFRKTETTQTYLDLMNQNREFGNWSKCLAVTVNCFGDRMDKTDVNVLYHGVSFMYFSSFLTRFHSPTSTSPKVLIASIFASNEGVILELINSSGLRSFNCSCFSAFPGEEERLFFQPPGRGLLMNIFDNRLKFKSIRNMKTFENYEDFISAMDVLRNIVDVSIESRIRNLESIVPTKIIEIMNSLMDLSEENESKYVSKCFTKWVKKVTVFHVNAVDIKQNANGFMIWSKVLDNLLRFDKINKVFQQIERVVCDDVGEISASYLKAMLSTLKLVNYSKLETILLRRPKITYSNAESLQYQALFIEQNWEMTRNARIFESYGSDEENICFRLTK